MPTLLVILRIVVVLFLLTMAARAETGTRPVIAVVAHNDGTEPSDFLVPFGVIANSGLAEVQAVALTSGPVLLHPSNLSLELPHTIASFDTAYPAGADYVIVPAVHSPRDGALIGWLRKQRARGATLMGICDGAKVLAHAGVLTGKMATAHWYALDELRQEFPETQWRNDRRFIFDGDVITTAGVSASVPATLALLERIAGREPTLQYAARLGIAGWPAEHVGSSFRLSGAAKRLVVANTLAFWRHERVAVSMPPGTDEASAALVMDAYSRTYRSSIALSAPRTRTRHGLILRSNGAKADRNLDTALLQLPLGETLDAILTQIERDYGTATAAWVATQLEYVWSGATVAP
jgi:putative intracellular protease/amidase